MALTDHSMDEIERLADSRSCLIAFAIIKNLGFAKACNIAITAAGEKRLSAFS